MKTIRITGKGDCTLHVETPLGIVNITVGLIDRLGRQVESIYVIPCPDYEQAKVVVRGLRNTRLVRLKRKARP